MTRRSSLRSSAGALAAGAVLAGLWSGTAARPAAAVPSSCAEPAPPAAFADRDAVDDAHRANVDCLAALGLIRGRTSPDGRMVFAPHEAVTRAQMASFVARTLEADGLALPAPAGERFSDVGGVVHRDRITQVAAIGVTVGHAPGRYEPSLPVTRGQMASFLARAATWADASPFPAPPTSPFTDTQGSVHAGSIDLAQDQGLVLGRTATTYEPGAVTTRQEMASFLVRLLDHVRGSTPPEPVAPLAVDVRQSDGFPLTGATISYLEDVRAAAQPGFDRVVLQLAGADAPSWRVRWVEGPIRESGRGSVVDVRGTAFLDVHLTPSRTHDLSAPGGPVPTYEGPSRVALDGHAVTEVVLTGDFEANLHWVIGLDARAPFAVTLLEDPMRLVVDIGRPPR